MKLSEKLAAHVEWLLEKCEELYPKYYQDDNIAMIQDDLKKFDQKENVYLVVYETSSAVEVLSTNNPDPDLLDEDNYCLLDGDVVVGKVTAKNKKQAKAFGVKLLHQKGVNFVIRRLITVYKLEI